MTRADMNDVRALRGTGVRLWRAGGRARGTV